MVQEHALLSNDWCVIWRNSARIRIHLPHLKTGLGGGKKWFLRREGGSPTERRMKNEEREGRGAGGRGGERGGAKKERGGAAG